MGTSRFCASLIAARSFISASGVTGKAAIPLFAGATGALVLGGGGVSRVLVSGGGTSVMGAGAVDAAAEAGAGVVVFGGGANAVSSVGKAETPCSLSKSICSIDSLGKILNTFCAAARSSSVCSLKSPCSPPAGANCAAKRLRRVASSLRLPQSWVTPSHQRPIGDPPPAMRTTGSMS